LGRVALKRPVDVGEPLAVDPGCRIPGYIDHLPPPDLGVAVGAADDDRQHPGRPHEVGPALVVEDAGCFEFFLKFKTKKVGVLSTPVLELRSTWQSSGSRY
jgi:hypothetical protein